MKIFEKKKILNLRVFKRNVLRMFGTGAADKIDFDTSLVPTICEEMGLNKFFSSR